MFELLKDNFEIHSFEIIDSIPADESQTAVHIVDHLLDLKIPLDQANWKVGYHRCPLKAGLVQVFGTLAENSINNKAVPLVHIECHGSKEGLQLASGEIVAWAEVRDLLFPLNCATRNRLFVVFGSCWGLYAANTVLVRSDCGVPFRMLAGPYRETFSGKIENCFKRFYDVLLSTRDIQSAIVSAGEVEPAFKVIPATEVFIRAWLKTLQFSAKTNKEKQQRVEELVSRLVREKGFSSARGLHKYAKRAIAARGPETETAFENYKRKFFMLDLFPEVAGDLVGLTVANVRNVAHALPTHNRS